MGEHTKQADGTQKIVIHKDSYAVTLTPEMLLHIEVVEGDEVIVEMAEDKLIIRKESAHGMPEGITEDFFVPHSPEFEATMRERAVDSRKE